MFCKYIRAQRTLKNERIAFFYAKTVKDFEK